MTFEAPILKEQAYERIKSVLLAPGYSPGLLSERQLSATLGISLGPVRAALERLRAERLIVVSRNTGIQVPDLTPDAILDFYEVRAVLEARVVERLATRDISARCSTIESILSEQEMCVARNEAGLYHELDMQFHLELASLYGNAEIVRVLGGLRDRMQRLSLKLHAGHPERLAQNFLQHQGILEAIRAGDPQLSQERLISHLTGGRSFILDPDQRLAGAPIASDADLPQQVKHEIRQ